MDCRIHGPGTAIGPTPNGLSGASVVPGLIGWMRRNRSDGIVVKQADSVFDRVGRSATGRQGSFSLAKRRTPGSLMRDFSIRMVNQVQFSDCEAPWRPITEAQEEPLAVELHDDILTLTAVRADGSFGSRIYAQRAVTLSTAMTFVILPQLPSRVRDGSFFPALGTVVLFDAADGEKRRLCAVGTDINSRRCRGWIFDALET